MTFFHSGDIGDLIYALPTMKMMGGGDLLLVHLQSARYPFTPQIVDGLRGLLELQSYINSVSYSDACPEFSHRDPTRWYDYDVSVNLNAWRWRECKGAINIGDKVAVSLGMPFWPRDRPWLEALPFCEAKVVINRTERYQNPAFPWGRVAAKYASEAVFIGHPHEHAAWEQAYGKIAYRPTSDWLERLRLIAGADLFIGNQSSLMALAIALCRPKIVQEVCLWFADCIWDRPGRAFYGRDASVELPEI